MGRLVRHEDETGVAVYGDAAWIGPGAHHDAVDGGGTRVEQAHPSRPGLRVVRGGDKQVARSFRKREGARSPGHDDRAQEGAGARVEHSEATCVVDRHVDAARRVVDGDSAWPARRPADVDGAEEGAGRGIHHAHTVGGVDECVTCPLVDGRRITDDGQRAREGRPNRACGRRGWGGGRAHPEARREHDRGVIDAVQGDSGTRPPV